MFDVLSKQSKRAFFTYDTIAWLTFLEGNIYFEYASSRGFTFLRTELDLSSTSDWSGLQDTSKYVTIYNYYS